jgi:hypothetical protein
MASMHQTTLIHGGKNDQQLASGFIPVAGSIGGLRCQQLDKLFIT